MTTIILLLHKNTIFLLQSWNIPIKFKIYLNKDCVILSVLGLSSISGRRIFPVEVQSVKVVLTEESNRASDERLPASRIGDERTEPSGTFVPSSDGKQGLQVAVVRFQGSELAISAWKITLLLHYISNHFEY